MVSLNDRVKAAASALFGSAGITPGDREAVEAGTGVYAPMTAVIASDLIRGMSAGDLYATQPNLRTVVSFIARNTAQLGRHVYTKTDEGRVRVETGILPDLLARPNEYMTGYDLFDMLFSELALYDMAIWVPRLKADGGWAIDPIPAMWVLGIDASTAFRAKSYKVLYPGDSQPTLIPAANVIVFRGYSPKGFQKGSSAVDSLKGVLEEQVSALDFRKQLWKRGGRVGNYLTRPATAPVWSAEAKTKFIQAWKSSYSGDGGNAGSTPLLEDGMTLATTRFNAKEEQWLEAATLALATVAGAYHVPPAMVGVSGYNSFASVKEFRKMLYTETMGPSIAQVEDTINTFLIPFIGAPSNQYLELNIAEKLQGDFEEQAGVMQSAVGGPYMTPDEARARFNLPKIEGGDKLLAPLNMGASGNNGPAASEPIEPTESDNPDDASGKSRKLSDGAHTDGRQTPGLKVAGQFDDDELASLEKDLNAFFGRQQKATVSALGSKDPSWWNQKQWNRELSGVLLPHLTSLSAGVARKAAGAKRLNPDDYSVGRTTAFLASVADSRADLINSTTRDHLDEVVRDADPGKAADVVNETYNTTYASRAKDSAKTLGTFVGSWAVTEMARQLLPDKSPQKTWVASGLPNSRHADMDGETVGINEKFSNGADWPGDPVLGAEGVANCGCGVDITY